ncbi:hypothetical protein FALBO_10350 [Fusarium albosuccineum]|uniref:Uncharacterized protein n=1 Tax=Fusarium albosuccineum TaxID=1237068 RepID=A0A8H4L755_9HYPO|nr:hypothetical protein FALBO_10350 [Fusarium albosuccineum]
MGLESIRLHIHEWRRKVPPKRPPFLLTTRGMALQLCCQVVIIVTICGLWHKSNRDNGITTVGDSRNSYFDSAGFHAAPILSSSIVWATVPAWIISAYSSIWSAMLDALKKVYPMLELDKANMVRLPGAESLESLWKQFRQKLPVFSALPRSTPTDFSTAKHTLLLDYGEWPILNALKAIRVGHNLLGICLLLRAALWTAGGLTAAIFTVVPVPSETDVALYSDKFFDEWLGWKDGKGAGNSSLTPALDIVSATVLRNGENYPWTTDTHSFLPFFPASNNGSNNYTFDTEAYWATVECNVATEEDLERVGGVQLALQEDDELNSAQLRLGFRYEGCSVKKWFTITNTTLQYARSWSTDCSIATGRARIGIFAGVYNATEKYHLSNLTVVTCKPLIYSSNVTLSVAVLNDTATAKVLRFTEKSRKKIWPFFITNWLRNIPLYSVYDPTLYNDMDTFSCLVIGHATDKPTLDTITGKLQIVESFGTVFQAFFSNFVTLQAYFGAPRQDITGAMSQQKLRLFVVKSAALAVVCIIGAAFITTLVLTLHLFRNRPILERYLDLMLGNALLFRDSTNSDLDNYLRTLSARAAATGKDVDDIDLVKFAKQQPDLNNWLIISSLDTI